MFYDEFDFSQTLGEYETGSSYDDLHYAEFGWHDDDWLYDDGCSDFDWSDM